MNSQQQIQVQAGQAEIKGAYSNLMQIQHTREEFAMDFFSVFPPMGALTARVITSPGHLKRMIGVLQKNLEKYEKQFGNVEEAQEPEKPSIGFGAQ